MGSTYLALLYRKQRKEGRKDQNSERDIHGRGEKVGDGDTLLPTRPHLWVWLSLSLSLPLSLSRAVFHLFFRSRWLGWQVHFVVDLTWVGGDTARRIHLFDKYCGVQIPL